MKLTIPHFSTKTRESSSRVAMPAQAETKARVAPSLSKDTF
jgi:hypothetical protein